MRRKLKLLVFLFAANAGIGCKVGTKPIISTGRGEIIYHNGTSKRTDLQLPDGTRVLLNPTSAIRLSAGFDSVNRDLFLEGEALFTVNPREAPSFVVHTKAFVTTVMDSSMAEFKVNALPGSPGEEVDLLTGILNVSKSYHSDTDNELVTLGAGEMVMINTDIDLMEKEKSDSTEWKDWIKGKGENK